MTLREKKEKRRREIQFCPICGSVNVSWVGGLSILAPYMECKGCGYRGAFVVGDIELATKVRETYLAQRNQGQT